MKVKLLLIKTSAALILFGLLCPLYSQDEQMLKGGDKPPSIRLYDSKGDLNDLSDYEGKIPVILTFFSTNCIPCKKEIPFLFYQSNNGKKFKLMLVVTDADFSEKNVEKYLKSAGVKAPYIYDPDMRIVKKYKVKELPHSVYIGKSGVVVSVENGYSPKRNKDLTVLIKSLNDK